MTDTTYVNPCYCLKLRRAAAGLTGFYDRMLTESGVTISQYSILVNLYHGEKCSISELAERSERDRSTIARNIKPLIRAGLIYDAKESGARDSCLSLTPKGQAVFQKASRLWEQAQNQVSQTLGPDGIRTLERLLGALGTI